MRVCKFGGTSVGSAERLRQVANIVRENKSAFVVLSAMSGTTNTLVEVIKLIKEKNTNGASDLIHELESKYLTESRKLFGDFNKPATLDDTIKFFFENLLQLCKLPYHEKNEKEILVQGEFITTQIFSIYMQKLGVQVKNISALRFMRTDRDEDPDQYYISEKLTEIIESNPETEYFITQGYVCKNVVGGIDNLGRGGSDYSATIIAAAIEAEDVQIWTDIDGMHNNDPRYVKNTQSIENLSYSEAEELAYFGAKILHPTCILPARNKNIPIFIKSIDEPEAKGTLITSELFNEGVKAVAAKDDIIAINIKSTRMMMAYGFLRKVFEVFEDYKTPIDMVTTSEVTVSMTIDNDLYLNEIVHKLNQFGEVTVTQNHSIICIVGNFHARTRGIIGMVSSSLRNIPLRMISFGASSSNITLLLDTENKPKALNLLSESLFLNTPTDV